MDVVETYKAIEKIVGKDNLAILDEVCAVCRDPFGVPQHKTVEECGCPPDSTSAREHHDFVLGRTELVVHIPA